MSELPRRLSPRTNLSANWLNRLLDFLRSRDLHAGPGIKLTRTPSGTTISAAPSGDHLETGTEEDVVPCRVSQANTAQEWKNGVLVDLYPNGFLRARTGSARVYLPEVGMRTKPQPGMTLLAHRHVSFLVGSGDPDGGDAEGFETEE